MFSVRSSLKYKFLRNMLLITCFSVFLWTSFWIILEYIDFKKETETIEEEYVLSQKEMLKTEVGRVFRDINDMKEKSEKNIQNKLEEQVCTAHQIASNIYEQNKNLKSNKDIEKIIKNALRPIRFNQGRGYIFAVSMSGIEKLYPVRPEIEGQNVINLQDNKENYVIQDEIKVIKKSGGGFVRDYWIKPGEDEKKLFPKLSFVKYFEPLDWYIGAGEYLDEAEKQIQTEVLNRLKDLRFGADGYFFGSTFKGDPLFSNGKVSEGHGNIRSLTDPYGVKIIQAQIKAAKTGNGGFISYSWPKLDSSVSSPKISYVMGIPEWEWVIGAGVYTDVIEKEIAEKKNILNMNIIRKLIYGLFISVFLIIIAYLWSKRTSNQIIKSIELFSHSLKKASMDNSGVDFESFKFQEFIEIAELVNEMINEREKSAKAIRESEEKVARLKKMESLGLLAGGVAHDLNNVLSGIISYPELMLMKLPEDSPLRKPLQTIMDSGNRAAAIVSDLLTIARGVAIKKETLDLNSVIKNFLQSAEISDIKKCHHDINIKTELEENLLNMDGSLIHICKVLINLVSNSAEAVGTQGRITIKTSNCFIDSPVKRYDEIKIGEYVVLSVKDNGHGISNMDMEKIFEPFYTKKVMGRSGTGLGLAIVWNVVHDHDGYIDVSSSEKGTIFKLYFPATRNIIPENDKSFKFDNYMGNKEKILVIDDVESQREITCSMLNSLNYKPVSVSGGEEALEYLKENEADLLLLDMIMEPGMNGRETYEEIIKLHPDQKAIIVSGFADTVEVEKVQKLGAGHFIIKPFTLSQIAMAVKNEL